MSSTSATDRRDERARLRQLIWFDVATVCTAIAVTTATYAFVERTGWLLVLSAMVALSGLVMLAGLWPLARDDLEGAVARLAVANWVIALAVTLIATFAWPLMMLAALLPAVVAAPYVSGRRLRAYVVVSFVVVIVVAVLGLYQDVSGFEDEVPTWAPPLILVIFTPFLAGMIVVTALQHSSRLQTALAETIEANLALRISRARLVAATDRERRRVERDLHDGVQARLIAMGLRVRLAEDLVRRDPEEAAAVLGALRQDVHAAHEELRDIGHGVYPPVLTQHGLGAALAAAADRCPLAVSLEVAGLGRFAPDAEAAIYFCCVEALQNAAKHAGATSTVKIVVQPANAHLDFLVSDDGMGFDLDAVVGGVGLDNMRDRVGAAGGFVEVRSAVGSGTSIIGRLPTTAPRQPI